MTFRHRMNCGSVLPRTLNATPIISETPAADFSHVRIEEAGKDRVKVSGAGGLPAPATLKVSLGYLDGYIGEGQISYGGPGAEARGRIALAIVAVPDGGNTTSWVLAAMAAAIALTAPALIAAWEHRGLRSLAGTGRADRGIHQPG